MKFIIYIAVFSIGAANILLSQNSKFSKYWYLNTTVGTQVSFIGGAYGSMRKTYINDLVTDLSDNGAEASGYLLPRIGLNVGLFAGNRFSEQFSWEAGMRYIQKGYREKLSYVIEDSISVNYYSDFQIKADYLNLSYGIKYHHKSGINIFLDIYSGISVLDRINQEINYEITIKNLPLATITTDSTAALYIHEYFEKNRKLYLPGFSWGLSYKIPGFPIEICSKYSQTARILDDSSSSDPFFYTFQLNLSYQVLPIKKKKALYRRF